MNDLVSKSEKMMTTKEVAQVLGVSVDTVQNACKTLQATSENFPKFRQGQRAVYNEQQVTAIKLELQNHSKVNALSPKTMLEKQLLIQQAMQLQAEMIAELQAENDNLKIELDESKEWTTLQKYFNSKGWETDRSKLSQLSKILGNLGYQRKKIYSVEYERGLWSYRIKDLDEYFLEPEF